MKIYKVEMDLSLAISRLKDFDLHEYNSAKPIIFVEAQSPDDACHKAYFNFVAMILKQEHSKEVIELTNDMLHDITITKVSIPK